MSSKETTPADRPLNSLQAARLSGLTGLPAKEFAGHSAATLAERLKWVVDPAWWLFVRVCGQVVKTDPATGIELPVPYATVEVFDTVCDYWGYFPPAWPWGWLFPVHCERELIATVETDACGDFCFWIPRFEIEWILRWREERVCFPDVFVKPTIADLLTPGPGPNPPDPAGLVARLRAGGDLAEALGARAQSVLSAARSSGGFGDDTTRLAALLRSPAFAQPVAPPLAPRAGRTDEAADGAAGLPARVNPDRYIGPFQRCIDIFVPEWYEFLAVPDVSISVTQAGPGGTQTIYDGAFDIQWGTNPVPPVIIQASPIAVASRVPCPSPGPNPDELGFQFVGLLPVSAPYDAGGTFNGASGFATRVSQPRPLVPPSGGCACDQTDLAVAPSCPATAPFYGELYLYGGVNYPGAAFYRIMAQYAPGSGIPTPAAGSFSLPAPLLDSWLVPQPFPVPPGHMQPVNAAGWYDIAAMLAESGPYTNMLMDWADAKADGVYLLTLELADAAMNPIPLSPAPTLLLVVDGSAPKPVPFTVRWQPVAAVGAPVSPLLWQTAYPPAAGCALIDTGGSAIALEFSTGASSPHLRQAWVSVVGCGGVDPVPAVTNPADSQWYTGSGDPSATSFSFTGVYYLPAGTPAGCYTFELYADTRAFNSAGGTTSNPVHTAWCGDEPGPPHTSPLISVAIV